MAHLNLELTDGDGASYPGKLYSGVGAELKSDLNRYGIVFAKMPTSIVEKKHDAT